MTVIHYELPKESNPRKFYDLIRNIREELMPWERMAARFCASYTKREEEKEYTLTDNITQVTLKLLRPSDENLPIRAEVITPDFKAPVLQAQARRDARLEEEILSELGFDKAA